jgi:hypothetical protein
MLKKYLLKYSSMFLNIVLIALAKACLMFYVSKKQQNTFHVFLKPIILFLSYFHLLMVMTANWILAEVLVINKKKFDNTTRSWIYLLSILVSLLFLFIELFSHMDDTSIFYFVMAPIAYYVLTLSIFFASLIHLKKQSFADADLKHLQHNPLISNFIGLEFFAEQSRILVRVNHHELFVLFSIWSASVILFQIIMKK